MAKPNFWKGFLAGAVGGAIGTVVLNVVQSASKETTRQVEEAWNKPLRYTHQQEELQDQFNAAHQKAAEVAAQGVGVELTRAQAKAGIPVAEFGFGILCAGVYGGLAEYVPAVTSGFGGAYGAALFTGASEVVLPALGWVPSPQDRTPVQHAGGLVGNVVYGFCTEAVRGLLRQLL